TGLDDDAGGGAPPPVSSREPADDEEPAGFPRAPWPADHELLAQAAGMTPDAVAPLRYGQAASPKLAAALAGERIDAATLLANARAGGASAAHERAPIAIVEGVGGLLVPLGEEFDVCDLAVALRLPVLIAARPGLGTINHTLLTLRAARAAGLDVRAVVLTPWPARPDTVERSNREEIERLGEVEVAVLRRVRGPDLGELERAGRWLPWRRWLGELRSGAPEAPEAPAELARPASEGVLDGAPAVARP
ncbi:MAG TPA: dethiobiotin synthase, partial [Solirubrobacteraceae bacterium]|nr:dethiobiotin synthase [Solirubrobacteraceae bacterium]